MLDDPAAAVVALDPTRSRLLAELAREPASAAGLASRVGLPRQKIGYHLTALQDQGLVVEVERRRHGGLTERVLGPSAGAYVVSTAALGGAGAEPGRVRDRLSAAYVVALAARTIREVGTLLAGASRAGKTLPTLAVDTDVRFASVQARAAFAADLGAAVRSLAARYHDESAPTGRLYRVVVLCHPEPPPSPSQEQESA